MQLRKELTDTLVKAVELNGVNVFFKDYLTIEEINEIEGRGFDLKCTRPNIGSPHDWTVRWREGHKCSKE